VQTPIKISSKKNKQVCYLFSNPSISALIGGFAGTFFAFFLVQLVEYTKTRKKIIQLYSQLDVLDNQIEKKLKP